MFKLKWGLIPGGTAFVLALISSLLFGGTNFTVALLRALSFAGLFLGLGIGIRVLIKIFLPELLGSSPQKSNVVEHVFSPAPAAGTQVNITLDDPGADAALPGNPGMVENMSSTDEVGDFSDLVSPTNVSAPKISDDKDIDQNPINSYTEDTEELFPVMDDVNEGASGGFSMDFGAFSSETEGLGDEGLGDDDSFMGSFSSFSADEDVVPQEEAAPLERRVSTNKAEKLDGDFNAKEIAAGLRTVLEKDKKG